MEGFAVDEVVGDPGVAVLGDGESAVSVRGEEAGEPSVVVVDDFVHGEHLSCVLIWTKSAQINAANEKGWLFDLVEATNYAIATQLGDYVTTKSQDPAQFTDLLLLFF
jgi:hypothetical protein